MESKRGTGQREYQVLRGMYYNTPSLWYQGTPEYQKSEVRSQKSVIRGLRKEPTISERYVSKQENPLLGVYPGKRTTPGIPTWSPTVVLTGPDDA
jgi:hypothetical protein